MVGRAHLQHDTSMTRQLDTDRAFVFDFGRVVFRWRPEALVSAAIDP